MKKLIAKTKIALVLIAGIVAIGLIGVSTVKAFSDSYQLPFSPYSVGGYDFGQFVSGTGYHVGQDAAAGAGRPVYATANGIVRYSAKTPDSYRWGNLVMIEHYNPDGSRAISLYGHLSNDRRVAAGQDVPKGTLLGFVGPSWTAENGNWGAHLHFEMKYGAYGAATGSYDPSVSGYVSSATGIAAYAHPVGYINGRNATTPPPPPVSPVWDYQPVEVAGTGSFGQTAQHNALIRVRNTGNQTWSKGGNNPVRLATIRPQNRGSEFSAGMGGIGWLSPNRIEMQADTPPGGIAVFSFRMNNVTVPVGQYAEYFSPVVENVGFMGDKNMGIGVHVYDDRVWDYQPLEVSGTGTFSQTAQHDAVIRVKNTGNQTWSKGGNNPVRLGTIRPINRGSGFSAGMGGIGWLTPNRIEMQADTPPGGTATFSFRMNNVLIPPGYYAEYFAPVVENIGFMGDRNMGIGVRVLPQQNIAEMVNQTFHRASSPTDLSQATNGQYMAPDRKLNLKAYVKNAGDFTWNKTGANAIRLSTANPYDRGSGFGVYGDASIPASENWLSGTRASEIDGRLEANGTVTPVDQVAPGETAVFSFTVKGVNNPGVYPEYFSVVEEGKGPIAGGFMGYNLRVVQPGYHFEYAGQDNPDPVALARGEADAFVEVRNTGQTEWQVGGNVRLGTDRSRDRASAFRASDWISPSRLSPVDSNVSVPNKPSVGPGEVARFAFKVTNPTQPDGRYPEFVQPLVEGIGWMPEDYGIWLPVSVQSAARDYQVISQRFDRDINNLHVGDTVTATLAIRNLGSQSWAVGGSNAVNLGASRPNERGSGFALMTGDDPWLSYSRASHIDGRVASLNPLSVQPTSEIKQGEVAHISVTLKIPALPVGTYPEYFNLVQEGVAWFPDYGIYFPLTIRP